MTGEMWKNDCVTGENVEEETSIPSRSELGGF